MATRASARKDPGTTKNKADTPAPPKPVAPRTATDLISPKKKAPVAETRPTRTGVPPISKIRPRETTPETATPTPTPSTAAPAPIPAAPSAPTRAESVSLIDEKHARKTGAGTGEA